AGRLPVWWGPRRYVGMVLPTGALVSTRSTVPRSAAGTRAGSRVASAWTTRARPVAPWQAARARLVRARLTQPGSMSMPRLSRPAWAASTSTVPVPAKGSRTRSPGLLYRSISVAARSGGVRSRCPALPATYRPYRCASSPRPTPTGRLRGQEVIWPTSTPIVRFRIESVMIVSVQDEAEQVQVVAAVPETGPSGAQHRPGGRGSQARQPLPRDRGGHRDDVPHIAQPRRLRGRNHLGGVHGVIRPVRRRHERHDRRAAAGLHPDARGEQLRQPGPAGRRGRARVAQGDQAGGACRQPPQLAGAGDRDVAYAVGAGGAGEGGVVVQV